MHTNMEAYQMDKENIIFWQWMVLTNDKMDNHTKEEFLVILGISESFQNGIAAWGKQKLGNSVKLSRA